MVENELGKSLFVVFNVVFIPFHNYTVIDSLDNMKKGKENYAAREAIKFLERSLQGGGRMIRVQADDETLQPGRKKPPKMDLNTWCVFMFVTMYYPEIRTTFVNMSQWLEITVNHFIPRRYSGLVDCALYFTHTFAERSSISQAATTLLLDQSAVKLVEDERRSMEEETTSSLANILSEAQLNGIPIETVVYTALQVIS